MSAPAPLLSVIVVSKNPGPRLALALGSVWAQVHLAPEVVVIDGGSTDGTVAWLESHRDRISVLVSEPDTGVYAAMNRGVALARGTWVLFLGADDRLVSDLILSEVANHWLPRTEAGLVSGAAAYDDGRIYRLNSRLNPLARNFVHHQATFYRRALFAEFGGFDLFYRVMADYEFNLRLWKSGVRFKPIPLRIAACACGGLSDAGHWAGYGEEIRIRHRYAKPWRCWVWDAASIVRYLRKKTVRSFGCLRHE